MKKKLSIRKIISENAKRLGITEFCPVSGKGRTAAVNNIKLINTVSRSSPGGDAIFAVFTPRQVELLRTTAENSRRFLLVDIWRKNILLIILSDSISIPAFLKDRHFLNNNSITVAASKYDKHYLKSILKALILENIQERISLNGVVIEAEGKGILITGASGTGKTTAALKAAAVENSYWIADDVAVIVKSSKGELIAGGNKKIKDYIHTAATGIINTDEIFDRGKIKKKTKLAAVVEIEKTGCKNSRILADKCDILGVNLPKLRVFIPAAGYFNENLLKKCRRMLEKLYS